MTDRYDTVRWARHVPAVREERAMAWAWRYEGATGPKQAGSSETFPSQSDAESWLGQSWRELAAAGVVTAVLVEDDRVEYRMSLLPAGE
jgi:hypothetical protein